MLKVSECSSSDELVDSARFVIDGPEPGANMTDLEASTTEHVDNGSINGDVVHVEVEKARALLQFVGREAASRQ